MKVAFKKYLMGLLKLCHSHLDPVTQEPSMSEALKCDECGYQVVKAQNIYNQRRKEHPEEFVYKKPEFIRSPELEKYWNQLIYRVKNDQLYKAHLERLAHGTEEEKDLEIKKVNEGYYQTHYEEKGIIKKTNATN